MSLRRGDHSCARGRVASWVLRPAVVLGVFVVLAAALAITLGRTVTRPSHPQVPAALAGVAHHSLTATDPAKTTRVDRADPGVLQVQLIPAVRDVQVTVDGTVEVSDEQGRLQVPTGSSPVTLRFIGYSSTPAVQQVAFHAWSDGSTALQRTVDQSTPDLQMAVDVSYQVTVQTASGRTVSPIGFTSAAGTVALVPGKVTWVLAVRAQTVDGELAAQPLTYTSADKSHQQFAPTPEAIWTLSS